MPKVPIHTNCKCFYKAILNVVDWSIVRYSPDEKYFLGGVDFNKNRKADEAKYGREIDSHPFSAPGKEIASDLKKGVSLYGAVKKNITFREGKRNKIYLDSKGIPSIGIGINLLDKSNQEKLRKAGVLTNEQIAALRAFKPGQDKIIPQILSNIFLSEQQIDSFFHEHYANAVSDANKTMRNGAWQEDGEKHRYWIDSKADDSAWNQLPELVKAIIIDLTFSLGYNKASAYSNFFRAIKAHDYRRAAIELINSSDYKNGDEGLKRRRRDAAIELTSLAEEEIQKKNKNPKK